MANRPSLDDYNDVPSRLADFRAKHPQGSLQPVDPRTPFEVVTVGNKTFIAYTAAAYRTPDDPRPGIGTAWELFPGPTPYTKDSELQNAETSAWGRAIVAALAADTRKGVASREEVEARQAPQSGSGGTGQRTSDGKRSDREHPASSTEAGTPPGPGTPVPTLEAIDALEDLASARALVTAAGQRFKDVLKELVGGPDGLRELWGTEDVGRWTPALLEARKQVTEAGGS